MKIPSGNNEPGYHPSQDGDMEARLWAFIDGMSEEKSTIEQLIAKNAEWRSKYNELQELNQILLATELEQPSMRFTKNVMDEIARTHIAPAAKKYINKKIIWGIAAFFISVIASFLVYGFSQVNWSAGSADRAATPIDFTKVDYSIVFNSTLVNVFVGANIVLGLLLLDRYLASRRRPI